MWNRQYIFFRFHILKILNIIGVISFKNVDPVRNDKCEYTNEFIILMNNRHIDT